MRLSAGLSLLVAVVFGAAAVFLVRALVVGAGSASATRGVVVASEAVAYGMPLSRANLREVQWPVSEPLEGGFATIDELLADGRRLALVKLARNEPVLAAKVTGPNQRATLSTQLDDGMRAVTVRVDEVRGVAGFVLPGDRVDVILTRGDEGGTGAAAYADMLLQNANVLAVDQVASERGDKPTVARAVTLELSQRDAQKVILAQGVGRLSLALRQVGAIDDPAGTARVTASDLGLAATEPRDRLAEIEKRLDGLSKPQDAARDPATTRRLSDLENRVNEMARPAIQPLQAVPPRAPAGRVVNVTRNGAKTEQYTVFTEN